MENIIIGIDLGTTNTLVATVFEDGPEVVYPKGESPLIPSVVHYGDSQLLVGKEALEQRLLHPENTVYSIKRLMGRDASELQQEIAELPYTVISAQRKLVKVKIGDRELTPQEVSAEILKKVKQRAETVLNQNIEKAVITVPAYFDDAQRQATRDAAKIAGLEAVRILNEPTAAAIAYGLDEKKDGYVAVYDLGGGTFDISILKLSGKVFKVVSTHGNTHLGGDDFDKALVQVLKKRLLEKFPNALLSGAFVQQTLKKVAEEIKIHLSASPSTSFEISIPNQQIHLEGEFTVEEFNQLILPQLEKTFTSCQQALKGADLTTEEIDEVVLVGGSTVIPVVRKQVETFFKRAPHVAIDPYKVVAIGAGIQGHLLAGGRRDFLLLDVIPLALGIETLGGTFSKLISQNTTIPTKESEMYTTNVDNQTGIDINIYQGERELVKDCRCLGQFKLRGLPPMPAGFPLVEVTFDVDANGILTVSALEKRSNTEAHIEVIPFHGLTQQEIEDIMEDSFEHAIEDFNERQLIEFRLTAERVFKGINESWEIAEQNLSSDQQQQIRNQMAIVQKKIEGHDAQDLKLAMDVLGELTRPLADTRIGQAVLRELKNMESHVD